MKKENIKIENKKRKDKLVALLTILLVAITLCGCKKDKKPDVIIDDEPVVTAEATAAPTEEPKATPEPVEVTPEPTEEPEETVEPTEEPSVVYEGIDMESDLPGLEWIETFVGIIDEPKVVVYSDVTGKKQIVEMGDKVFVNPEEDMLAIYVPDGCNIVNKKVDIYTISGVRGEHCEAYVLDAEKTKEKSFWKSAFCVKYDESEEEIFYKFTLKPQ